MSHHDHYLDGPAGRLAYRHWPGPGAKRALIFLPGLTCHAGYFADVAPGFTPGYDVYALDWRGHGGSAPAADGDYGFAGYVADLAALVRALAPTELALVGHSLGGYVALLYAASAGVPLQPARIVACDVKTGASAEELAGAARAAARPQPVVASLAELAARLRKAMPDSSASDAVLARLTAEGACPYAEGVGFAYDRRALAIGPVDPYAFAGAVACPTLVLCGDRSEVMSLEQAVGGRQFRTVPGSSIVEKCGKVQPLQIKNSHQLFKVFHQWHGPGGFGPGLIVSILGGGEVARTRQTDIDFIQAAAAPGNKGFQRAIIFPQKQHFFTAGAAAAQA